MKLRSSIRIAEFSHKIADLPHQLGARRYSSHRETAAEFNAMRSTAFRGNRALHRLDTDFDHHMVLHIRKTRGPDATLLAGGSCNISIRLSASGTVEMFRQKEYLAVN